MTSRHETIFQNYLGVIDAHLADVLEGKVEEMFELRDVAKLLFIHPGHLSNVIKEHTGKHPCYFYEKKILAIAKRYLEDDQYSVADVARLLTYDPSNFTKWFRTYQGVTPSQYRAQLVKKAAAVA